jgi:hypothetical protein
MVSKAAAKRQVLGAARLITEVRMWKGLAERSCFAVVKLNQASATGGMVKWRKRKIA